MIKVNTNRMIKALTKNWKFRLIGISMFGIYKFLGMGYLALALNISVLVPQWKQIYDTKKIRDISEYSQQINFINCMFWLIYAIQIVSVPNFIISFVSIAYTVVLLYLKRKPEWND